MLNKHTERLEILPSSSDYSLQLGYPDIFALFQDITVHHSKMFRYDQSILTPQGLFWVIARNRVRIHERPRQGEFVELSTWPEKPVRIRGRRNYTIHREGKLLIEATTEWVIVDRNNKRLYLLEDLYDPDFVFCEEKILEDGFFRFSTDPSFVPFAETTVRSIDIDFEGHMNNVSYIRALFSLFSRSELDRMKIKEIEVHYKVSCYEGDRLLWYRKDSEDAVELYAKLEDNTEIFFARLLLL